MTDEAKALVERLRWSHWYYEDAGENTSYTSEAPLEAADLIETQARENERLREGHREIFEQWAGSEGFIPETAPEAYLLQLTKRMADIARAALGESHE